MTTPTDADREIALRVIISQNSSGGLVATYAAVEQAFRYGQRQGIEMAAAVGFQRAVVGGKPRDIFDAIRNLAPEAE